MKIFWIIYSSLFCIISVANLLALINPASPIHQYYQLLIQFNPYSSMQYWASLTAALLTLLASIIVIAYALKQRFPLLASPFILFLRIFFDIIGHGYEWQAIYSNFHISTLLGVSTICLIFILPLAASYFAHCRFIQQHHQ